MPRNECLPKPTSPSGGGERRRREPARKLARIVAAGRQIFARQGYNSTTVRDICEAADVSVGTFYAHFADKAELIAQVMEAEGLAMSSIRAADLAAADRLEAGIREFVEDPLAPGLWRAWREAILRESALVPVDRQRRESGVALFDDLMRKARASSGAGDDLEDPAIAAWAIQTLLREVAVADPNAPPIAAVARLVRRLALGG